MVGILKLYDAKTQTLKVLEPKKPGRIGMYVCGPTLQSPPHLGHLRSALIYDVLRRWLEFEGLRVVYIRNQTDIDDKILAKHSKEQSWWELAYGVGQVFAAAYADLGIAPPSYEPLATAHIPQMISLIKRLIERGHAYVLDEGVFFDARSLPSYGELTRQSLDSLLGDGADSACKNPQDFALWKAAKPGEPEDACWSSPWGPGRPGWHIECTAMALRYLREGFDIHGGGVDLRFPHHENELAQAQAAGFDYATVWMHAGAVNLSGQKMSKSLGNCFGADRLPQEFRGRILRYYFLTAHYRHTLEFSLESLAQAALALERVWRILERLSPQEPLYPEEFCSAMREDMNLPKALAVVHDYCRKLNRVEAQNSALEEELSSGLLGMCRLLGVEPVSDGRDRFLDLTRVILDRRQRARRQKDYALSDALREILEEVGQEVKDNKISKARF